ncbi:P-loop containing nucleoside triphosphate hydrolase protein [Absidia repens]|uniref:p-loop containing nucleoside triphosphate hydrolase protein n=1 Tax=Absidia repens TaxID=90262 RepID=A0A1X2IQ97_9FUNG|nr:P-loop containing nucleoside triphosphate hydrolase protein [Absidia repens]
MTASTSSVRVAVRVRPLTETEKQNHCKNNINFVPNEPQINVGPDRSFTFDYTYTPFTGQKEVFDTCVIPLVNKYIDGYNSTILAYGQTGSGKTFSMGIGLDSAMNPVGDGIVPLFIDTLFDRLQQNQKQRSSQFEVSVSFLELYNEEIVDLLSATKKENTNLSIREDHMGTIHWSGVREEKVTNAKELFDHLKKGSIARTTASTDMNHTSSRSHAIFSVVLKQTIYGEDNDQVSALDSLPGRGKTPSNPQDTSASAKLSPTSSTKSSSSDVTPMASRKLVSKFHFVDLAGSERLKRTNAVGDRAKEGISINSGLLALGNVISALGDESRRVSHIPYRDSKLTRLLQDSLGGNSQTLMLACVSPADLNHTETLNTLKYANRARNIRNRVVINQELTGHGGNGGNAENEQRLKTTIMRLKDDMRVNDEFLRAVNDEMDELKLVVQQLQQSSTTLASELAQVKGERDLLRLRLQQSSDGANVDNMDSMMQQLTNEYTETIEKLRLQLNQQNQQQHSKQQQQQQRLTPAKPSSKASSQPQEPPKEKTTDVKKKRHSYRIGSLRRSLKGRHRTSTGTVAPKATSKSETFPTIRNAKQVKADIRQENQFIQATLASLDSLDLYTPTDESSADIFSTVDGAGKPQSTSSSDYPPLSITAATLCRQLIQRFQKSVDGKNLLLQQLDRTEQQRRDSVQQLELKLSDEKQKRTIAQNQHKEKINELSQQHEQKQRKQLNELQTLRRKHTQLVNSSATTRTQQENAIRNLKTSLEDAKHDKKKALKRVKQDLNRFREKCQQHEREMEKGRRLEKQTAQTKKKMERDLAQARTSSKKLSEENQALQVQLKHMSLLAKRSSSGGQHQQQDQQQQQQNQLHGGGLPLSKIGGGSHLPTPPTSTIHQRTYHNGKRGPKKDTVKFIPLQQRVIERKRLILRAITAYAKSQAPTSKINELYEKRDRLLMEQQELLKERELVIQEATTPDLNIPDISSSPQYMDERIDAITPEIDLLNYCIQQLEGLSSTCLTKQRQQQQQTDSSSGKIDDDWVDVVDQDTHIVTTGNTAKSGESGYDIALSLVRTLEMEEPRLVCEALVDDLIQLKQDQYTSHLLTGHLTATLTRHQEALIRMRRTAHERPTTTMDGYYQHAFHGPIRVWNGLVLLASPTTSSPALSASSSVSPSSSEQ